MAVDDFREAGLKSDGLTNNNAGNIRPSAGITPWMGQVGVSSDNFVIFSDISWSIRAWLHNFFTSVNTHGTTTLSEYIYRYAPAKDGNDPAAYTAEMASTTGIDPNAPMPLDMASVQNIMQAQFGIELGQQYAQMITPEDYSVGFQRYGNPTGSIICAVIVSANAYPIQTYGAAAVVLIGASAIWFGIYELIKNMKRK